MTAKWNLFSTISAFLYGVKHKATCQPPGMRESGNQDSKVQNRAEAMPLAKLVVQCGNTCTIPHTLDVLQGVSCTASVGYIQ